IGGCVLAMLTLALGALTRQRLVAALVPIAVQYLVPVLIGLLLARATRGWAYAVLPSTAMTALTTTRLDDGAVTVGMTISADAELPYWGALLVLGAWCAVLLPIAIVAFLRRDITVVRTAQTRAPAPLAP